MKTKVVEFVVQDCPIMGKVIHRHYIQEEKPIKKKR